MSEQRTQVGIVGAGPAGLMLGQLLALHGIDTVIVEARSQSHVIERVRAGVLEQGTVDLMHQVGLGDRLERQGLRHEGIYLAFSGRRHRIDMAAASNGRAITVYGQNEVVRDLIDARVAAGLPLHFEAPAARIGEIGTDSPGHRVCGCRRTKAAAVRLRCRLRRLSRHLTRRHSIRPRCAPTNERIHSRGLASSLTRHRRPTSSSTACHESGFALFSMRSPTVTRLYLQCDPDEPTSRSGRTIGSGAKSDNGLRPMTAGALQKA